MIEQKNDWLYLAKRDLEWGFALPLRPLELTFAGNTLILKNCKITNSTTPAEFPLQPSFENLKKLLLNYFFTKNRSPRFFAAFVFLIFDEEQEFCYYESRRQKA